jgi:integrase
MKAFIKEKRPTLSDSSVNTYNSTLSPLYKKIWTDDKEIDPTKFTDTEKVLDYCKTIEPKYRKTIMAALVVITGNDKYRQQMIKDKEITDTKLQNQTKTEEQKENWLENDDIQSIIDQLKKNAMTTYKKKEFNPTDLQEIQKYVLVSLMGGIYIPPRRAKDYFDFKVKNIDREKDNYLDKNELVFNSYKTAKTYGEQRVTIPKELKSILSKWIKSNPTDYLFFDYNGNQLDAIKINQRLNAIFKKKVGINQLRKTYLSGKYAHTIQTEKDKKEDMESMGSSVGVQNHYIKE